METLIEVFSYFWPILQHLKTEWTDHFVHFDNFVVIKFNLVNISFDFLLNLFWFSHLINIDVNVTFIGVTF